MLSTIHFKIPAKDLRKRIFEIIPGFLSWTTILGLGILAFVIPFWIAVFIIMYDVYILIRVVYMSVHLIYAYRRLKQFKDVQWRKLCETVSSDIPWDQVHHIVIYPTYNESLEVLRASLGSLLHTDFPLKNLHVVVGFEERVGLIATERAKALQAEFENAFGTFLTTFHPDGLPGEKRVKSANATWAVQHMEKELQQKNIPVIHTLVSNFDSDTVVSSSYFSYLTYTFLTVPDRYQVSYQPLPMYNNNIWDAPSFSRVIASGSTFWQMIESTRPERLVTFSSHSMTLKALKEVGYWQKDIISEDSHIFWQCLLHYNGQYRTEPLYTTVSMDAALGANWWQTLKNQYKQKRRWAWGIENFAYLAEGFLQRKNISWRIKFTHLFRTLEGHHAWATTPIIIAGLGWLPIFFGGMSFQSTVLSYNLPFVTRTIMSVAMGGLLISSALSLFLLPARPRGYTRFRYIGIIGQWVLVPFIAVLLSSFPALDAETRLMLGRDLQFNVMQKTRRQSSYAV